MKRTVKCEHQDDIKNCPKCWQEFTTPVQGLAEILQDVYSSGWLDCREGGEYYKKDIAEATAQIIALVEGARPKDSLLFLYAENEQQVLENNWAKGYNKGIRDTMQAVLAALGRVER